MENRTSRDKHTETDLREAEEGLRSMLNSMLFIMP